MPILDYIIEPPNENTLDLSNLNFQNPQQGKNPPKDDIKIISRWNDPNPQQSNNQIKEPINEPKNDNVLDLNSTKSLQQDNNSPTLSSYAKPLTTYFTKLSPNEEKEFQRWIKQNKIPFDSSPQADYDMRGYWKALQAKDPNAKQQLNNFDGTMHFPDTYKTPYHKTFSNESIYALPNAPHWEENKLIDEKGNIVADETPRATNDISNIPVTSITEPKLIKKNTIKDPPNENILDLSSDVKPIEQPNDEGVVKFSSAKSIAPKLSTISPDADNKGMLGRAAENISRMNEPDVKENSPFIVLKTLRFSVPAVADGNELMTLISKNALVQLGKDYADLGESFKTETGFNLSSLAAKDLQSAIVGQRVIDGKPYYDVAVNLTKGALDLFNAYHEKGLEGYREEEKKQLQTSYQASKEWQDYEKYYSGFTGDVRRAIGNIALSGIQTVNNLTSSTDNTTKITDEQLAKLPKFAQDTIRRDLANQEALNDAKTNLMVRGSDGKLHSYNTFWGAMAGESLQAGFFVAGLGPVPLAKVYLDNSHLGWKDALKATAGFAAMMAVGHFVGDVANNANYLPATRQILVRGSQGTTQSLFAALNGERDPQSLLGQFAVGSLFPIGKGKETDAFTNVADLESITNPTNPQIRPDVSRLINQSNDVLDAKLSINNLADLANYKYGNPDYAKEPLGTKIAINTAINRYLAANKQFGSTPQEVTNNPQVARLLDSPKVDLNQSQAKFIGQFAASGLKTNVTPATFKLSLEDASVLLSDLNNFKNSPEVKNLSPEQNLVLNKAISNLDNSIPEDYKNWFKDNEQMVRDAINPKIQQTETAKPNTEKVITQENNSQVDINKNIEGESVKPRESYQEFLKRTLQESKKSNDLGLEENSPEIIKNQVSLENYKENLIPLSEAAQNLFTDENIPQDKNNPTLQSDGTILNSGLNPEEFLKQARLLWSGIKDFTTFSKLAIQHFGEAIKPYLEKIHSWIQSEFAIKGNEESQGGFLGIKLSPPKNPALEQFLEPARKNLKESKDSKLDARFLARSVYLAQSNPQFAEIWNTLADAKGLTNSYKSNLVKDIATVNDLLKGGLEESVATAIYDGNEQSKVWSDQELQNNYHLNADQIKAYRTIRDAQNRILDQRLAVKLYPLFKKLETHVPNSGGYNEVTDEINKLHGYYRGLKNKGYVSLQRLGKIAVFAEDPNFAIGDVRRKLYTHVDNQKEALATLTKWFNNFGAINGDSYYIKNLNQSLRFLANKVTPATFENLVDAAGVDAQSPEIVQLRDEVYQKFPSSTYELKRDFTRGYEKSYKNLLLTMVHQNEVYGNNYYSKIGGEEAKAALARTNLAQTDTNMYNIATDYIKDAISPYSDNPFSKILAQARSKTYLMQLGYRFWQFVNHGIVNPLQNNLSYFSRIGLTAPESVNYALQGLKLSKEILKEGLNIKSSSMPQDFRDIYQRLSDERLIAPDYVNTLLDTELNKTSLDVEKEVGLRKKSILQKFTKEWPGIFQKAGIKTARTIVASEAFLVGKEKFNLVGEELYKFIRQAIVATQGDYGKAENPYIVRKAGEFGKLLYQFSAYHQIWAENLALAMKADKDKRWKSSTYQHLAPLVLTAGIKGLPMYALARTLLTLSTGKDPEEEFRKLLKDKSTLVNFALYGVSSNAAVSQKLGTHIPVLDNLSSIISNPESELSFENLPAVETGVNIATGFKDLFTKGKRERGIEELSPTVIRNILQAVRESKHGAKDRAGHTIVSKSKLSTADIISQGIGLTPTKILEKYDKARFKGIKTTGKKIRKSLSSLFK